MLLMLLLVLFAQLQSPTPPRKAPMAPATTVAMRTTPTTALTAWTPSSSEQCASPGACRSATVMGSRGYVGLARLNLPLARPWPHGLGGTMSCRVDPLLA